MTGVLDGLCPAFYQDHQDSYYNEKDLRNQDIGMEHHGERDVGVKSQSGRMGHKVLLPSLVTNAQSWGLSLRENRTQIHKPALGAHAKAAVNTMAKEVALHVPGWEMAG